MGHAKMNEVAKHFKMILCSTFNLNVKTAYFLFLLIAQQNICQGTHCLVDVCFEHFKFALVRFPQEEKVVL